MRHLRILLVTLLTIVSATIGLAQTDTNWYIEYYGTDFSYHKVPMVYDEGSGSYTIEAEVLKNWGFWFKDSNDVYYGNTRPDSEKISFSNATDIPLGILDNGGHDMELSADGTFTFILRETADGIFLTITGWPIEPYAVLDGSTLTFYYDELKETRPGTKYTIPWENDPEWAGNTNITTVDFHESFANYEDLTSTYGMFKGLSELTEINHLSRLRTDNVTNMSSMFVDCSKLETIDLSQFATFNVISMSAMFYGCSSLKSFSPSWQFDTGNVIDMAQMFSGCSSLESIYLGNFNTENVTNLVQMFYDCSRLTELDISNFNTAKVTNMNSLFMNCSSLTSLDVRNLNTANNSQFAMMFSGCSSLTSLDLTGFNTTKASWMLLMFENCTALTTIYCNDTWSCSGESHRMFSGCTSLHGAIDYDENKVDVTYANPDDGYFTSQDVPYATLSADGKTLTFYYDKQKSSRTEKTYSIPWTGLPGWYGSTTITTANFDSSFATYTGLNSTENMFSEMKELVTINGLANLKTDNVTNMKNMFSGSSKLQDISGLTSFNTENVTNMSYMFSGCFALTTIDVSSFNTENVEDMRGMFYNCSSLTTIYCNNSWSETWHQSTNMFKYDYQLKSPAMQEYDPDKTDATYANPTYGYFTLKYEAYAVVSSDGTMLTFYYDYKKGEKEGTKFDMTWGESYPGWTKSSGNDTITIVKFDESFRDYHRLTSAYRMFDGLKQLSQIINLDYLDTENVTNMYSMFYDCKNLESLDVTNFNTENVTTMLFMFYGCEKLKSLDLSNFNTENVTTMRYMFSGCKNLESLDLSNFNTENVETLYRMFENCSMLENLNLSNFNTAKVTDMHAMFRNCSKLKNLIRSNFNTTRVTTMGAMFEDCSSLESIDLSDFNTADVTYMNSMFCNCSSLTSIDLSSFNTEKVTSMNSMFEGCSSLTSLDLSNFNTKKVGAMNSMFKDCSNLEILDLTNFNRTDANNIDIGYTFQNCSKLKTIYCNYDWNAGSVWMSADMFGGCTSLEGGNGTKYHYSHKDAAYAHPDEAGNPGYFTIYQETNPVPYAIVNVEGKKITFYYDGKQALRPGTKYEMTWDNYPGWTDSSVSSAITKAVFDPSFDNYYNLTNASYMFYNMRNLAEIVDLRYLHTENVLTMSNMFSTSNKLTIFDVSGFDTHNVTDMSQMFAGCPVSSLDLSNFNTENVTNMYRMFRFCTNLTSVDLTNFNTANVENMSGMFGYCSSLTSLDLRNFNTVKVTDMSYMFSGCSNLETIYCNDDWNRSTVTESGYMFGDCYKLTGGEGTTCNPNIAHSRPVAFAHPDAADNPGYFTWKALPGDVNQDGHIDVADVTAAINIAKGNNSASYDSTAADLNGDGEVTQTDVKLLVNRVLGIAPHNEALTYNVSIVPSEFFLAVSIPLDNRICKAFDLTSQQIADQTLETYKADPDPGEIVFYACNSEGTLLNNADSYSANPPGYWLDKDGNRVIWQDPNTYLAIEFNKLGQRFDLSQYPNHNAAGDTGTYHVALRYKADDGNTYTAKVTFNVTFTSSGSNSYTLQ